MVNQATRKNLYLGIKVGNKNVDVNSLQFVEDTLFVYESSVRNIMTIKVILRCFELGFDLRVNFHESKIGAIEVDRNLVYM